MTETGRLTEKVAVITGAASGIGRATALLFAREGAKLVLADINQEGLKESLRLVKKEGHGAIIKKTNVAVEADMKELIDLALDTYSRIDILCNNAGITGEMVNLENQDADDWHTVLDVNLMGAVFGTKHVSAHMQTQGHGAIVNTASVAGIRAGAGGNAYSASKAALINFTQTSACELGGYNVRVNAVCPGLIETNMTKPVFDYARETGKEWAILFLASDEASYITGQALPVDGGNTASLNLPGMKV
jgi:NAD(P)-dependent dehydrogenase (short-subunit alcohol dehydrogenase family)